MKEKRSVVLQTARNVLPNEVGYTILRQLAQDSNFTLPANCNGLFYARTTSGGFLIFATTRAAIYRYVANAGWADYTRVVDGSTTFTDSNAGGVAHTWTANGISSPSRSIGP